ncbi:hypothetical protein [Microlunatus flavus]|uniref:Uncharacterized protein n=1 Tax=Microlunatus flavus TaxID=1036181 RepID=A0A1H9A2R1_9ACTN|nr:hypothetical protein [Microlunatus flavus]SEP70801.1 hypothetical protein SAMN05421756_101449 [Microlunatus flavus]
MANRRRAVERATFRRKATDRVVAGVLVLVGLSGLMSVLPGHSQRAVSYAGCRVVTLGLGTCGAPGLDLSDTSLAPARCPTLATLDAALPEVRVRQLSTARGLPVVISTARSGDVVVQLGDAPQPAPPTLLDGATRPRRPIVPGVDVPAQAEWYLPRGQGLDELVGAVQDGEHEVAQNRSALALLAGGLDRDERTVPPPTLLTSTVDLREQLLPQVPARTDPVPPRTTTTPTRPRGPVRSGGVLTVRPDVPARLVFNRVSRTSTLVATLGGTIGGRPATGTLRVERDPSGNVLEVLLAVVTQGQVVPGEPRTSLPGPAVAYVRVPVRTPAERELVGTWLAGPSAATVPLDELLGLATPSADDQLASFLSRAATVTVLRYAFVDPAALQDRVTTELVEGRRQEWDGIRLVEVVGVAPTPTGAGRVAVSDPPCRT